MEEMKQKIIKKTIFTIRLRYKKTKEKIVKLAKKNNTFINEIANIALEEYLKKHYKD